MKESKGPGTGLPPIGSRYEVIVAFIVPLVVVLLEILLPILFSLWLAEGLTYSTYTIERRETTIGTIEVTNRGKALAEDVSVQFSTAEPIVDSWIWGNHILSSSGAQYTLPPNSPISGTTVVDLRFKSLLPNEVIFVSFVEPKTEHLLLEGPIVRSARAVGSAAKSSPLTQWTRWTSLGLTLILAVYSLAFYAGIRRRIRKYEAARQLRSEKPVDVRGMLTKLAGLVGLLSKAKEILENAQKTSGLPEDTRETLGTMSHDLDLLLDGVSIKLDTLGKEG
jgi:membrane protein implicated in regulation of membrane protease activity